jgi:hypothetical protein
MRLTNTRGVTSATPPPLGTLLRLAGTAGTHPISGKLTQEECLWWRHLWALRTRSRKCFHLIFHCTVAKEFWNHLGWHSLPIPGVNQLWEMPRPPGVPPNSSQQCFSYAVGTYGITGMTLSFLTYSLACGACSLPARNPAIYGAAVSGLHSRCMVSNVCNELVSPPPLYVISMTMGLLTP